MQTSEKTPHFGHKISLSPSPSPKKEVTNASNVSEDLVDDYEERSITAPAVFILNGSEDVSIISVQLTTTVKSFRQLKKSPGLK